MTRVAPLGVVALALTLGAAAAPAQEPVAVELGPWTRWSYPNHGTATPRFFSLLAERFGVAPPSVDETPFRYSVAVLVGIQDYEHFDDFEFVRKDVEALRSHLLGRGGFDSVYVLRPEMASPDVVERLIKNELRAELESRDRLLFYFSGHGTSANATTGYMAFGRARPGDFVTDLLPVSDIREWSALLPVRHALFVLDSCSAGFGIRDKGVQDLQSAQMIIEVLKGRGSRMVLTAGTENEKSLEITNGDGDGGSLFTLGLLHALNGAFAAGGPFDVVLTTEEVFSGVQKWTSVEAKALAKSLTPDLERYQNPPYSGSFLFLNPRASGKDVDADLARGLGLPEAARSPAPTGPQSVAAVIGLGGQRRSGQALTLDFGNVGQGPIARKLTVELLAAEPVPLRLAIEGDGVDASFTGGLWSAVCSPGQLIEIDVTLWPERLGRVTPRIELWAGGRALTSIRVVAIPANQELEREVHSGPQESGRFKSFSRAYRLCLGPPPAGYGLVTGSDEFWLTGDRRCGAWATCEARRRDDIDVCWEFTLQGHDEILQNSGIRFSEGHLRARYALRESETVLRSGG